MKKKRNLTPSQAAHADSIVAAPATVEPLPRMKPVRILLASVIRKPPEVVRAFLQTTARQQLSDGKPLQLDMLLYNDSMGEPYGEAVQDILTTLGPNAHVEMIEPSSGYEQYADTTGHTRQWTPDAWHRIGGLKDRMLAYAAQHNYDGIWLVDTDVLCETYALQSLLQVGAPIVSGVYWTHWQRPNPNARQHIHAGPQVWLRHPYHLSGHGWTEAEFRRALIDRELLEVGGLGACTLINRQAIDKGVSFSRFAAMPPGPMSDGEDRHFCARASALHIPLFADAWPDIYHAYHPQDYHRLDEMVKRLTRTPLARAGLGDAVSLRLARLETGHAIAVRGILGRLPLLPDIEATVLGLPVGQSAITRVHFPVTHPDPQLAGQSHIMEIALLDAKPGRPAPTIDEEILTAAPGVMIDPTTHTDRQVNEIVDAATATA